MYKKYFKNKKGRENLVFDDPSNGYAYYLPDVPVSGINAPLWKITYSNEKVIKIVEEHFD